MEEGRRTCASFSSLIGMPIVLVMMSRGDSSVSELFQKVAIDAEIRRDVGLLSCRRSCEVPQNIVNFALAILKLFSVIRPRSSDLS